MRGDDLTVFRDRVGVTGLRESPGLIYKQIADALANAIRDGRLTPGEALPPERELAKVFGVSRITLRHALQDLARQGLLIRTVGRSGGTFVAEPEVEREEQPATPLEGVRQQQIAAGARVVSALQREASPVIAAALGIQPGSPVYEIVRLRFAHGRASAQETTYYSAARLPGLLDHRLDGSIYDLLRTQYGEAPERAFEYLEPIVAGAEQAVTLGTDPGVPLLFVERIAYDRSGEPLEFSRDVYRGDRTRTVICASEAR